MKFIKATPFIFFVLLTANGFSQTHNHRIVLPGTDSLYIVKYPLKNDLRLFYGGQGNNMAIGSKREGTTLNRTLYTNTNDFLGLGITYKWMDGDVSFSLPGTTYLNEERSTLTQFKLSGSFSFRKIIVRGYLSDSKGVILSDSENEFQSTPSLHEQRIGVQMTYLFNSAKYSYRAAMYQSEFQQQTAGSVLLRIEPFYRNLGSEGSMIPSSFDTEARYGDQVGLEYVKAPGILIMPGYGVNFVLPDPRYFISPMIFAGAGVAHNTYRSANGKNSYTNIEYAGYFNLNAGYSSTACYAKIQFSYGFNYAALNPSYLTSVNLIVSGTFGIRIRDVEKFL